MRRSLRNVAAIMNPNVTMVSPDTTVDVAARLMMDQRVSYVVVMQEGKPVGVCSERDVVNKVAAKGLNPSEARCGDVMTTPAYLIRSDAALEQAYDEMEARWSRRLVVTDESGELVGQITQSDLISGLYEEVQEMLEENERLHAEALRREKLAAQARIAREVQTQMLPSRAPEFEPFEFAGANVQAHEVGGDFFDYIPVDEDTLGVAIGDVVGNGIPAAMLMVMTRSLIRAAAVGGREPDVVLQKANTAFVAENFNDQFVTAFYCAFNRGGYEVRLSNAGHLPLMVWRQDTGEVELADTDNLPLGIRAEEHYLQAQVTLRPGDAGLLYTDGLVEIHNAAGEMFGLKRLRALFARLAALPPAEVIQQILAEAERFAGEGAYMDDRTAIAFRAR